jgi:hypothetical protein
MHQLIYAPSPDEALGTARTAFDQLVGADLRDVPVFDYYVTFDEAGNGISGADRWGDLPTAARVDSEEGQALLDRGWEATKQAFDDALASITEGLDDLSPEEIMHDKDSIRYHCYRLGQYAGPTISLYDEHGRGIRHRDHLEAIQTDAPPADYELWIVPADVHY